jgi:hypothetical protein
MQFIDMYIIMNDKNLFVDKIGGGEGKHEIFGMMLWHVILGT